MRRSQHLITQLECLARLCMSSCSSGLGCMPSTSYSPPSACHLWVPHRCSATVAHMVQSSAASDLYTEQHSDHNRRLNELRQSSSTAAVGAQPSSSTPSIRPRKLKINDVPMFTMPTKQHDKQQETSRTADWRQMVEAATISHQHASGQQMLTDTYG